MLQEDFFSHIETQYTSQLPFVAYRKPNETKVNAVIQKDTDIHTVVDFTESGFVFAPFDSECETIIFPSEISITMSSQIVFPSEVEQEKPPIETYEVSKDSHIKLVQKGIERIDEGQLQKVVLSRVERKPLSEENPIQIFQTLLKNYTSAFVYIWYHPKVGLWLGATPETLLQVKGRQFKTMSLAGTQPYYDITNVEWDTKNIEEHQFVTDFIVEELQPYTDLLNATPAKSIKAGQLLHLQSEISGTLKQGRLEAIIRALHPTPAVCGLPKIEAKDFILKHENYNREFYTGFLGELNITTSKTRNSNRRNVENNAYAIVKKTSELFVNLRCMQIKDQHAIIYVGGGVTKDSKPQKEWEETVGKTQTMLTGLK